MEQGQYLIDTNSIIDYLGGKIPQQSMDFMNNVFDESPIISVITKIELLGFDANEHDQKLLNEFILDASIIELNSTIADVSI